MPAATKNSTENASRNGSNSSAARVRVMPRPPFDAQREFSHYACEVPYWAKDISFSSFS
jgi:hypothetical protein